MFAILLLIVCVSAALYYAKSSPNTSAFGMPVATGQIPDVFGVGRRSLRRSTKRAIRNKYA